MRDPPMSYQDEPVRRQPQIPPAGYRNTLTGFSEYPSSNPGIPQGGLVRFSGHS